MTTNRDPSSAGSGEGQSDRARELRHQYLAELLAAYADRELPAEMAARIDAHLLGCARCRRALMVQVATRDRLAAEPTPAVPAAFAARLTGTLARLPGPSSDRGTAGADRGGRYRLWVSWSGWAVAAGLAMFLGARTGALIQSTQRPEVVESRAMPARVTTSVPMVDDAVANYRMVMAGDLPGKPRDLAAVRAAVAFPFEPIAGSDLRLLAAWTTTIRGEPAAALAYRWGDLVVVQYLVSEELFFHNPAVRRAIAASRGFVAVRGQQSVVAWPEPVGGTLLVGEGPPERLAQVRELASRR